MEETDSTGRLIDYYSLLFTFPSRRRMLVSLWLISAILGTLSFIIALDTSNALSGLLYGVGVIALPITLTDQIIAPLFSDNPILTPRRINIVSYFWVLLLLPFSLISAALAGFIGEPRIFLKGLLFAASLNAGLRTLSIPVFSEEPQYVAAAAGLLQPAVISLSTSLFFEATIKTILAGLFVIFVVGGSMSLALWLINERGRNIWEPGLIQLFRAFIYSWAEDCNKPLEDEITEVGERRELEVETLFFRSKDGCSAVIVVPYIHPGPFRSLGSSAMPWKTTRAYREHHGCEALVMHGLSKHEMDLTNSQDLDRVIEALLDAPSTSQSSTCTPLVEETVDGATASCQLFGDRALINLTLSPKSHDDLPPELLIKVRRIGEERGVWVLGVDSHNSLETQDLQSDLDQENLFKASLDVLDKAVKLEQRGFKVGVARIRPNEWSLDEGMGPGGITSMLIELSSGERHGYILVDSNNMISGLRESILLGVEDLIDKAVVCTSDTHMVNALGATTMGYSPFGKEMEEVKIIQYIRETIKMASSNLSDCSVEHQRRLIEGATILGEEGLDSLAGVIEAGFTLFKNVASTLGLAGIISAIIILALS